MSRRRPSLMDILEEEQETAQGASPSGSSALKEPTPSKEPPASEPKKPSKSDYIRLSITVPPEIFERLQNISLERRRARQPYTFCHLTRQAIVEWLDQQEKDTQ